MKTKLFFELAKANGINESEIRISNSTSISVETLNGQIDSYNVSETKNHAVFDAANLFFQSFCLDRMEEPNRN